MRWFSFWESWHFFQGDIFAKKLILSQGQAPEAGVSAEQRLLDPELAAGQLSDKEELRRLKLALGSWSLAPLLITPTSFARCKLLAQLGKPMWSVFSYRAKHVTRPQDVETDFVLKSSSQQWAAEVQAIICNGFFDCGNVYKFCCVETEELIDIHYDLLSTLLSKRVQSLSAAYLVPPIRYAGVLKPEMLEQTSNLMSQEFSALLKAEAMEASGSKLKPLGHMHWRLSSVARICYLAQERNRGELHDLMKCICCHVGDTSLVENVHKEAKDLGLKHVSPELLTTLACLSSPNLISACRTGYEMLAISRNPEFPRWMLSSSAQCMSQEGFHTSRFRTKTRLMCPSMLPRWMVFER